MDVKTLVNFTEGDIVVVDHHTIKEVIGQTAEVVLVRSNFLGSETWYVLTDGAGKRRAAAHSWLRRLCWSEFCQVIAFEVANGHKAAGRS